MVAFVQVACLSLLIGSCWFIHTLAFRIRAERKDRRTWESSGPCNEENLLSRISPSGNTLEEYVRNAEKMLAEAQASCQGDSLLQMNSSTSQLSTHFCDPQWLPMLKKNGVRVGTTSGNNGEVYLIETTFIRPPTKAIELAVKMEKLPGTLPQAEVDLGKLFDHAYLIKTYDHGRVPDKNTKDGKMATVMEAAHGGALNDYMPGGKNNLHQKERTKFILEALAALTYLHELPHGPNGNFKGFVHGDLKEHQFIFDKKDPFPKRIAKLTDWGWSCPQLDDACEKKIWAGSPMYVSPEHARSGYRRTRDDLWSMGIVIHQLVYDGKWPWFIRDFRKTGILSNVDKITKHLQSITSWNFKGPGGTVKPLHGGSSPIDKVIAMCFHFPEENRPPARAILEQALDYANTPGQGYIGNIEIDTTNGKVNLLHRIKTADTWPPEERREQLPDTWFRCKDKKCGTEKCNEVPEDACIPKPVKDGIPQTVPVICGDLILQWPKFMVGTWQSKKNKRRRYVIYYDSGKQELTIEMHKMSQFLGSRQKAKVVIEFTKIETEHIKEGVFEADMRYKSYMQMFGDKQKKRDIPMKVTFQPMIAPNGKKQLKVTEARTDDLAIDRAGMFNGADTFEN